METTNDLRYRVQKVNKKGQTVVIKIRLNDECKNGHNDFSITGEQYEKGKPLTDRYCERAGAIGDDIAKWFPEFAIFNRLHLCDVNGAPMHASANGFYHLKNGFNNTKVDDKNFEKEYKEYYRMTDQQFHFIKSAEDEFRFRHLLYETGVVENWKSEADQAIVLLEELTGKKFKDDSVRFQLKPLDEEESALMMERMQTGYYKPEQIAARKEEKYRQARQKMYNDIRDSYLKTIKKAENEYNVKKAVLDTGMTLDNFIYYHHTNEGCFNWYDFGRDEVTQEQFDKFIKKLDYIGLPKGIVFKLKDKK